MISFLFCFVVSLVLGGLLAWHSNRRVARVAAQLRLVVDVNEELRLMLNQSLQRERELRAELEQIWDVVAAAESVQ